MYRYAEGNGTAATFDFITDIDFLSSTELICTDRDNQCLRIVNFVLSTPSTSTFAGACTMSGHNEGHRVRFARFKDPEHTEVNSDKSAMYVLEFRRILFMIDLTTDSVTRLLTLSSFSYDMKFLGDNLLFFAQETRVIVIDCDTRKASLFAGTGDPGTAVGSFEQTRFKKARGLLPWTNKLEELLFVADNGDDRLVGFSYHVIG